ncbi:MAG: NAD-dependent epimerase/dehydratase family protein [Proteobacteria bacterium]|nr:NAD-dependent epimerase/dehydratase family protein [Pseudomonadota bacterium]
MTAAPRRILLTGGSGFVGTHLRAALAVAYPDAAVVAPAVDVRDPAALAALVAAEQPEVCVHLAAIAAVAAAGRDEETAWQVNLHGALHLANAILHHAPACQLLYVSSADAYGGTAGGAAPIDENTPLAPSNVYAATKAAADLALGSMVARGLRVVRLRPFNHTGPGQSADYVVPAFARQIARIAAGLQPPVLEVGNLDTWRDFLDVRDVCAAYIACIDRRATLEPGTILNLCSGQARRIGEVLDALLALAGVTAEVRAAPSRVRGVDIRRTFGDAARARALLGWVPAIPWARTVRDVLDDWRTRCAAMPEHA